MVKKITHIIILLSILSCNKNDNKSTAEKKLMYVSASDTSLQLLNGILYYHAVPFTGALKEDWPNGQLKNIRHIANGRQQGLSETFYSNGKKESSRWYANGEKDSTHTGWWENGNKKYEYHFKKGNYNGMFEEWYEDGKILQQVMYADGKELYGKGWRENGQLYMNFIIKEGRRYGMNNAKLCYEL